MPAFSDATAATLPDLVPYTWRGGDIPTFGASWGDIDNDNKPDLILCRAKTAELFHNENGVLKASPGSGIAYKGGSVQGASWADFDNDGKTDVMLYGTSGVRILRNVVGRFENLESAASQVRGVPVDDHLRAGVVRSIPGSFVHATSSDFDNDGFLDILLVGADGQLQLYRGNNGTSFTDVTVKSEVGAVKHAAYVLPTDFDGDRAVDILAVGEADTPSLLKQNRDGSFGLVRGTAGLAALGRCRQIAAADLNGDGLIDYAAATDRGVQIAFHLPDNRFKVQPIVGSSLFQIVHSVAIADLDKDGKSDVIGLMMNMTGMGGDSRIAVYQGRGDGTFVDESAATGLDMLMTRNSALLALADVDGDGAMDIFLAGARPLFEKSSGNRSLP